MNQINGLLHDTSVIRVTRKTLMSHSKYKGSWSSIILDGWRYDIRLDKFYRIIRTEKNHCPHCNGTGIYKYETGVEYDGIIEFATEDCFCTFRSTITASTNPQFIPFVQWN